jgi:hypothetical protein
MTVNLIGEVTGVPGITTCISKIIDNNLSYNIVSNVSLHEKDSELKNISGDEHKCNYSQWGPLVK